MATIGVNQRNNDINMNTLNEFKIKHFKKRHMLLAIMFAGVVGTGIANTKDLYSKLKDKYKGKQKKKDLLAFVDELVKQTIEQNPSVDQIELKKWSNEMQIKINNGIIKDLYDLEGDNRDTFVVTETEYYSMKLPSIKNMLYTAVVASIGTSLYKSYKIRAEKNTNKANLKKYVDVLVDTTSRKADELVVQKIQIWKKDITKQINNNEVTDVFGVEESLKKYNNV